MRSFPFPFLSPARSLDVLRVGLAGVFLAHAGVRVLNGSWRQFAAFLDGKGLRAGLLLVGLITLFELVGGVLLALGRWVRPLAAGFVALLAVGIVLVHAEQGWFVGEHGTGGSEYSVVLMLALAVVAAHAPASGAASVTTAFASARRR